MKILLTILCSLAFSFSYCQPLMEVDGSINIGNSTSTTPSEGTIRWNTTTQDFEGYNGSTWLSLTVGGQGNQVLDPMTVEEQYITTPKNSLAQSGYAVAIQGEYAFVGSPGDNNGNGSVHVFKYSGDQWFENQTLLASNGAAGDGFGSSVAVSGDKLVIGAYILDELGDSNPGKVYFFHLDYGEWIERQWMDAQIESGDCIDIDGNFAIIGKSLSSKISIQRIGFVEIFQYNGSQWSSLFGTSNTTLVEDERFGNAVAINQDWAVMGASSFDGRSTVNQGMIRIYKNTGNIWQHETDIVGPLGQSAENFGYAIDISGDTIAVSAIGTTVNGKVLAGAVHLYTWDGQSWSLLETLNLPSPGALDLFGSSISFCNGQLLAGSHFRDINGNLDQGIVVNFRFNGTSWKVIEEYVDPEIEANVEYGWSVATNGVHRIVGVPQYTYGKVVIGPVLKIP